jgi:hypothetical protein
MSQTLILEIPDDVYKVLTDIARHEGKTPEEMSAQWVATTVERIQHDPVERFIGAFSSGVPDWADRHDEYLGEALMKEAGQEKNEGAPDVRPIC